MKRIENKLTLHKKEILKRIKNYTMIENEMHLGYIYDEFIAYSHESLHEDLDSIWRDFSREQLKHFLLIDC